MRALSVMFPASAGMNRFNVKDKLSMAMFPASAGMNRFSPTAGPGPSNVPRVRGDEPDRSFCNQVCYRCSPRPRG